MRQKIRSRGQKNSSDSTHMSFTLELEQHFLIWGKFTPWGEFPRFRG